MIYFTWELVYFIILVILPIIFSFFGNGRLIDDILLNVQINGNKFTNNDIMKVKEVFILLGIMLTIFPLGFSYIKSKIDSKNYVKQRDFLISYVREMFFKALESKLGERNPNINIRIFVPYKKLKKLWYKAHGKKYIFKMKNVNGFTDNSIKDGLELEVSPRCQGLVGQCYNKRTIVYSEDLTNDNTNYNLNDFQKSQTCDTVFCLCIPIFNSKDEIIAIMTLDSKKYICISESNKRDLFVILKNFSKKINEELPYLFKS